MFNDILINERDLEYNDSSVVVYLSSPSIRQELEQEKREAEEAKRKAKQKSLLGFLQNGAGTNDDDQGSIEISLAGLFKCLLCTHGKPSAEKQQLVAIAESLEHLGKRLETIER